MSKQVLVTDSLFINDENVKQLEDSSYEVIRLDKPKASEEELCEAIKGKVGYILGGIEDVTNKVIDAADSLEAIVFTGTGYKGHIPAWKHATEKGIAIANVPDGPTQAVAEWSLTAALSMNRGIFDLAAPNGEIFKTTKGLNGQTIGIIALGRIGGRIAEMVKPFRPKKILYYSTHRHLDILDEQDQQLVRGHLSNGGMIALYGVLQIDETVPMTIDLQLGHNQDSFRFLKYPGAVLGPYFLGEEYASAGLMIWAPEEATNPS